MSELTALELQGLVQEERFGDRIVEISEITVLEGYEAGLAVYKDSSGNISVSDVLFPDTDYIEAMRIFEEEFSDVPPRERLTRLLELMEEGGEPVVQMPEISLGRLITDENVQIRPDLAIIAHSHPIDHLRQRDPRDYLRLSSGDVASYAEALAFNPGLLAAITATHRSFATNPRSHDNIALRLSRPAATNTMQNLQTVRSGQVMDDARMAELGLRSATLTFSGRTGRVVSGLSSLPGLWEPLGGGSGRQPRKRSR